ncbi:hypothetical protein THRCLA_22268 [Thraustotheca clavata]|uniref:Uncharacterized protein n=1 Tax=Thraustotheca clavata TaxID=74557 RepID=A0A1V9Z7G9_9STRA|nr:hypothetical protein THRCLA_22268 [Thraustotheca clavata]
MRECTLQEGDRAANAPSNLRQEEQEREHANETIESNCDDQVFQLHVRPIVKSTVLQRDSSGVVLSNYVVNASPMNEIIMKLWEKYKDHVKGIGTRDEERKWSVRTAE